jgi:hypothetical protein
MPLLMTLTRDLSFIYTQILAYKYKLMKLFGVFQLAAKVFETTHLQKREILSAIAIVKWTERCPNYS